MVKNREINGTEEIALVTPTPELPTRICMKRYTAGGLPACIYDSPN